MKTFNRGKLRKLAEQGKLVVVESYRFDDQTGERRANKETPVRMRANSSDWREGFYNLDAHDFTSTSGRAYQNDDGTITLVVHSNRDLTFRLT